MTRRRAGVLLHPTSLPGPFGIGDLGPTADRFLAWMESAGQSVWQVLPLGPTGYGNSPYGALSAFAGNPLLISPEELERQGLLPTGSLNPELETDPSKIDFAAVWKAKGKVLRESFIHFRRFASPELRDELALFVASEDQRSWLDDWALFASLKHSYGGAAWHTWDRAVADREPDALERARQKLAGEIAYHQYEQFLFHHQWSRVRDLAGTRGVTILGDIPIYVAHDSSDVWSHRHLFDLDKRGLPIRVAGVPPDYFSKTGQLWGNPLYRWDRMAEDGFSWWIERVRANLRLADFVRLDHFRGFASYWAVPAEETTAVNGEWLTGPGMKLFEALRLAFASLPIVAEDLGVVTEDVEELLDGTGFPGMRILQFAFGDEDSSFLPHNHVPACVVYTGTHDNATSVEWLEDATAEEKKMAFDYLGCAPEDFREALIRAAYTSVAELAIVPMQDVIGAGREARLNMPGRAAGNWTWRLSEDGFDPATAARLRRLAEITARCDRPPKKT